jgi:hypothetical protein
MPRVDGGTVDGGMRIDGGMGQGGGPTPEVQGFTATGGAGGGAQTGVGPGYIDDAIPATRVRIRFDSLYDDNRPDRAEFFYPKCGCFRTPDSKGPPLSEKSVDAQELSFYLEYAVSEQLSGFVEVPIRFINPEVNANRTGLSDINFGAKYAFISGPDLTVSAQLRAFGPTGEGFKGLGTEHWTVEPALLLSAHPSDRLYLYGELRDWIPLEGSDFAGNIIRYGVGVGVVVWERPGLRVAPIGELVGWTVLDGKEEDLDTGLAVNARGDTIVNAKIGVRVGFGEAPREGLFSGSDLYIGYGRALTGEVWYKDIVRVEYRLNF